MPVKGIRPRGNLVRGTKLVMSVVELVHGFMVTIGEDCRFRVVGVMVRTRFRAVLRMHQVSNVFGDRVEVLFQ